ncbi:HDOD domain-containing protein [Endozoicomonas sp. G2_1]|uniref:HDOD domain-containing protein n=1 Tax=Endozoicomonas sp. G2_1 TaxID=2821091 RepID=UPI001ADC018D|nr:HDOD domain-containing protein [Endozoicomonas sp. G2_1]MBO9489703.1 HDOD domain-containing protein [Endozoicomonas sp. G2_1]
MFGKLIKRAFSTIKSSEKPNWYYFEEVEKGTEEQIQAEKQSLESLSQQTDDQSVTELLADNGMIDSPKQQFQKCFYRALFGQIDEHEQADELSRYIAKRVQTLLNHPKALLQSLPVLPASLNRVIAHLNDEDFDTNILIELVKNEPAIAAKVIQLANSSLYNRSGRPVTDLKNAFMLLGANGLSLGVLRGYISQLIPQSDLYFKYYGQKIWQHSLMTSQIAQQIMAKSEHKKDAGQGYLVGLLSNLGNVIIYQLMSEAFTHVHPDCKPGSKLFINLLAKNASRLSYLIAKYWNFPAEITDVLAMQVKLEQQQRLDDVFKRLPLAGFLYEATILSQLSTSIEYRKVNLVEEHKKLDKLILSVPAKAYLNTMLDQEKAKQKLV